MNHPRSTRLIVFVRAPRPGSVKTRLAAEIGADEACAAYRKLLDKLMPELRPPDFSVELRHTPDDAAGELTPWVAVGWEQSPQGDGDLGQRLKRAALDSIERGFRQTLIIGSDCPYLTAADLLEARNLLLENDVVLGPAKDGGYWLIGMRDFHPRLFREIPWSTDRVFSTTFARATEASLKIGLLRTLTDVDTADDWRLFIDS